MSSIFVSHAVADKELAALLVKFLKEAIGVPTNEIFCSSVPGHGIPLADDFNEYIKSKIKHPKIVLLLMTPAYLESSFCLMELGAAWAQSTISLAIVVPPVEFQAVTKTLGLKQAWSITNKDGLVDFRQIVRKALPTLEERSDHDWDSKRTQWGVDLKKVLPKLQPATKVDAAEYSASMTALKERELDVERLEDKLVAAQEQIAELEKMKDKKDLIALKKKTSAFEGLELEFQGLILAAKSAKPSLPNTVIRHMIMEHFGRAGQIDWMNDRPEFETAVKFGCIDPDDGRIQWERAKLAPFKKAIEAIETFLAGDDGEQFSRLQDPDVPMDVDDLDFWITHLRL